jgi:hypothetical protein
MLEVEGQVAGIIGGIYSEQIIGGRPERFCNITSWAVREDQRSQSTRLLMHLASQKEFHFTNFSPIPVVEKALQFLKFSVLDEQYAVIPNRPWPVMPAGVSIGADLRNLDTAAARVYQDHCDVAGLTHLAIREPGRCAYVALRRAKVKGLPAFEIMHASDVDLLDRRLEALGAWLALRRGAAALKSDRRFLARAHRPLWLRPLGVRKYFKSPTLMPSQISNLYSELITLAN